MFLALSRLKAQTYSRGQSVLSGLAQPARLHRQLVSRWHATVLDRTYYMIQQERRLFGRKTLRTIACIHLPSDNGGIVLDVSEGGLRFRAIAPVKESGPIDFW